MQHRAIFVASSMLHLFGHHAARRWMMLKEVLLPSNARRPKNFASICIHGIDLLFIFAQSLIQSPLVCFKALRFKGTALE